MKTNQVLKSVDRVLFGHTIKQNTKEQTLSVSDLQKAYDIGRWQHGWGERGINTVMQTQAFRERTYHLLFERGVIKVDFPTFMEMCDNEGVVKVLKGLRVWKTSGRGTDKAVYCDPYIWVLLAMEMNPLLYAKVVIWLTDTLIMDRIEAGSEYLPMNAAIKLLLRTPDYGKYAKTINNKVFGFHQPGMRNLASAKDLRRITDIEKFITNAINIGWIRTESSIIAAIENYN